MLKEKSKTTIKEQKRKKTDTAIQNLIQEALRHPSWFKVAKLLSGPTRKYKKINLFTLDKLTKTGDTVVVVGKILSTGELTKKIKICALSASEKAKHKIKESKSELISILEEIKKNPKAEGIKLI